MADGAALDVAIVGGGPAGSAAALALRAHDPSLRVGLFEASRYDAPRVGETLVPQARRLLEQLGAWEGFLATGHLRAFGTRSSWGGVTADNDFIASLHGDGWHLDRAAFDQRLVERAEAAGAALRLGARLRAATRGVEGWRLEFDGLDAPVSARFAIDASGRRAALATRQGARRVLGDRMVGAAVFFDAGGDDRGAWTEPAPEGWWYSARLPGGRAVAMLMTDGDLLQRAGWGRPGPWTAALARAPMTAGRLAGAAPLGPPVVKPAGPGFLDRVGGSGDADEGPGWLAVGDAASTFDPLSGQGIVKSLTGGMWAAFAAWDLLAGRGEALARYAGLVRGEIERHLATREGVYAGERRWPDALFWRRRRAGISLDPAQALGQGVEVDGLRMHLPVGELAAIRDLCATPRSAAEVVAAFRGGVGARVSDRRAVLAVQYLVEEGVLVRVE